MNNELWSSGAMFNIKAHGDLLPFLVFRKARVDTRF